MQGIKRFPKQALAKKFGVAHLCFRSLLCNLNFG